MKIAVVGTGYVGLVLGACLAENGNDVTCIDKDDAKVRRLRRGVMPIYEPGLEEMVRRNQSGKAARIHEGSSARRSRAASIVFIAVGTPQHEDGSADLTHVLGVAREIAQGDERLQGDRRQEHRARRHGRARARRRFGRKPLTRSASSAIRSFSSRARRSRTSSSRTGSSSASRTIARRTLMLELYAPFTRTGAPIMVMDCASAELSKYAANAILATRISFMNEVANVCEAFGANVDQVRKAIGSDRRIGPSFLFPGIGFGGSCFPKDIKALIKFAGDKGYDFQTLKAVERVNEAQKVRFISKLEAHFGSLRNKTIAVWGLSFKPRTDDMREAPAIPLINRLLRARAKVQAYDPQARAGRRGGSSARKSLWPIRAMAP